MGYWAYLSKHRHTHTKLILAPYKTEVKSVVMSKINKKDLRLYLKGLNFGNKKLRTNTKGLNYLGGGKLIFSMRIYTSALEFRGCKCIRTYIAFHILSNFWRLSLNMFSWGSTPETPDCVKGILFLYTLDNKSYLYILPFQIELIWVSTTL